MYRKSIRTKRLEAKRKRCAAMRAAKERKRMERVSAMTDVGGITTDGILGEHSIRILSYGDGGRLCSREDQEKIGVWTDPDGPCPGWESKGGEDGQP